MNGYQWYVAHSPKTKTRNVIRVNRALAGVAMFEIKARFTDIVGPFPTEGSAMIRAKYVGPTGDPLCMADCIRLSRERIS